MKIYHWEDENGNASYFTRKEEARRTFNRVLKDDIPGTWTETEVVILIEQKDDVIRMLQGLVHKLSVELENRGVEDVEALCQEWRRKHEQIWATGASR